MFIKKEIYEDLVKDVCNLNSENYKLKDMNRVLEDKIRLLNCEKEEMKLLNNELEEEITRLEKRKDTLDLSVQDLARENLMLIEWINKIVNDLGTFKVSEHHIQIPVLENPDYTNGLYLGKKVTIPSISFYKVERRDKEV